MSETLAELNRQRSAAEREVWAAKERLQGAVMYLSLIDMRIKDHKDYIPRKPDFGQPLGMPNGSPRITIDLSLEDFNL